jgi:hypothetical protein
MTIQIISESNCSFSPGFLDTALQSLKSLRVSPQDFNFEIDEELLAAEMQEQLLCSRLDQTSTMIDTEELGIVYQQLA